MYDIETSSSCSSSTLDVEVLVWLASYGNPPVISTSGSPISTPTIGLASYDLFQGTEGGKTVYTFVSSTNQQVFAGDLKSFLTYLVNNQGLTNSRCVQSLSAGTETYVGSGLFNTTVYTATLVAL